MRHSRIQNQVMKTLLTHRTQATQAAHATQAAGAPKGKDKGKGKSKTSEGRDVTEEKVEKRSIKKPSVLFTAEEEQKLVDFLHDNETIYNKCIMDYKDWSKRETVWDKFCADNNMDKYACQRWFQSQCTRFGKVTNMKSGQVEPQLTERQQWTRDNFAFLRDHIMHHLTAKSEFRVSRRSASKGTAASRQETVNMELFQDTSLPESTDDSADLFDLDTQTPPSI